MARYSVTITTTATAVQTVSVEALDKAEAKLLAMDQVDVSEYQLNSVYPGQAKVSEVKEQLGDC